MRTLIYTNIIHVLVYSDFIIMTNLSGLFSYIFSTDVVAFGNAHFGAGSGTIHLQVVDCTGRETNLTDCPQVHSSFYCLQGHSEDAGVRCQGLKNSVEFEW